MPTTYVPAVLPGGDVPLRSALAFVALAQEVTQAKLVALLDGRTENVSAGESAGPRLSTVADHVAAFEDDGPRLTGYELFEAVVYGEDPEGRPWAPRFAAVMVWVVADGDPETADSPANRRPVTEEEAGAASFPTRAFAEAWAPFYSASAGLTTGLLGTPSATGSSSTGAAPTTTTTPA